MVAFSPLILAAIVSASLATPAVASFDSAAHKAQIARRHHARLAERADAPVVAAGASKRQLKRENVKTRINKRTGQTCKVRPSSSSSISSGVSSTASASSTAAASTAAIVSSSNTGTASASAAISTSTSASVAASASASSADTATSAVAETSAAPSSAASSSSADDATSASFSSSSTEQATASTSSSTAAASSTSSASSSTSTSSLTPNGKKAGIAGTDSYSWMKDHIGWYYDWTPNPAEDGTPIGVPMLWGDGSLGTTENDASRLATFLSISTTPAYILAFEEPDCSTTGSADMTSSEGATAWDSYIAPWAAKGSLLGSPALCKQAAETWLTPFENAISTPWDFTTVHINKVDMDGVKLDLDHYASYGKPLWITEFACVDDTTWTPCTDQTEINTYINDIVDLFESDSRVMAYAYSDGEGLGDVWPTVSNGELSESGQTYLAAISKYN